MACCNCHKHFFSPRRHCSLTQHWHVHSSLTLSSASLATFSVALTARRWQTNLHELLLVLLHPLHPQTTQPTRHRKLLAGSRQALLTLRRQTMGPGGVFWDELGQRQRQGGTGTAEDDQQRKVMKVMSCDSKKVRHAGRGHLVNMGGNSQKHMEWWKPQHREFLGTWLGCGSVWK